MKELKAQLDAQNKELDAQNKELGKVWQVIEGRKAQEGSTASLEEIELAYELVHRIHDPKILNPAHPGNQHFMRKEADDFIIVLRSRLIDAELGPARRA